MSHLLRDSFEIAHDEFVSALALLIDKRLTRVVVMRAFWTWWKVTLE
jgi:hypothetical protein